MVSHGLYEPGTWALSVAKQDCALLLADPVPQEALEPETVDSPL